VSLVTLLLLMQSAWAEDILFQADVSGVSVDATAVDATVGTTGAPLDPGSFVGASPFVLAVPAEAEVSHVFLVLMSKGSGFDAVTSTGVRVNGTELSSATLLVDRPACRPTRSTPCSLASLLVIPP
jgi:hypothetical protein